jgi:chromosomal replication initiation ATPase DnaA
MADPAAPPPRQLPLPFLFAPQFDAGEIIAAPSNADALAWLGRTAEWPQRRLALWGEAGSGKSHLLHRWAARSHGVVLPGPGLRLVPPTAPLAIDDADAAPERPLLHVLNAAAEAGLPVLLAGATPPARWPIALPDLASRLRAVTAVEIRSAEDTLLRALLARLLAERQIAVAEPVQDWLRLRLPRTAAAMREAAARLDRAALAAGGRVTRALAGEVLADMTQADGLATLRVDEDFPLPSLPASPGDVRLL